MAPEARLCCTRGLVGAPEVVGMTDTQIVELALQGMTIAAKMCAPILLTALLIGFAISLFQSVTQIQEATLSFVPKAAGVGAALLFSGNWMLHEMVTYTTQLFERIPSLLS
jgi:flagellar biosynthesis protein FliQ